MKNIKFVRFTVSWIMSAIIIIVACAADIGFGTMFGMQIHGMPYWEYTRVCLNNNWYIAGASICFTVATGVMSYELMKFWEKVKN